MVSLVPWAWLSELAMVLKPPGIQIGEHNTPPNLHPIARSAEIARLMWIVLPSL